MTLATPTEPMDRAFFAEIESYLATYGYKVTKARATRASTTTEPTCDTCGAPALMLGKKKKDRRSSGTCRACWLARQTPIRPPADPIRYARLYALWRKAHRLYRSSIRTSYDGHTFRAHPRYARIMREMQKAAGVPGMDRAA